jgi:hypothetical protein
LVIFFIAFAWALFAFAAGDNTLPLWKVVESVDERITKEVTQIRDLKKVGERVGERRGDVYSDYAVNQITNFERLYVDIYCSSDLGNKIEEIQRKSGIVNLYLNRKPASAETLADYIRSNGIMYLIPDSFTNSDNTKLHFLQPLSPTSSHISEQLVFYKKAGLVSVFYFLETCVVPLLAIFAAIAIAYYKIFIYIAFGSTKKG